MAAPRRILRLQQLILEILAETIHREIQDPRVGMVTLTRIRLSQDLSSATVFWSTLGDEAGRRTTERGLERALPLLQRRVAEGIGTRVTPTLSLRFDPSLEKAERLNELFNRLRAERGEPPAAEVVTPEGTAPANAGEDASPPDEAEDGGHAVDDDDEEADGASWEDDEGEDDPDDDAGR